jgi:hypothetical protein
MNAGTILRFAVLYGHQLIPMLGFTIAVLCCSVRLDTKST